MEQFSFGYIFRYIHTFQVATFNINNEALILSRSSLPSCAGASAVCSTHTHRFNTIIRIATRHREQIYTGQNCASISGKVVNSSHFVNCKNFYCNISLAEAKTIDSPWLNVKMSSIFHKFEVCLLIFSA